jgi:hypothetical protein
MMAVTSVREWRYFFAQATSICAPSASSKAAASSPASLRTCVAFFASANPPPPARSATKSTSTPTPAAGEGDATNAIGGDDGVHLRGDPAARVPAANTAGNLSVALGVSPARRIRGRGQQEPPARWPTTSAAGTRANGSPS